MLIYFKVTAASAIESKSPVLGYNAAKKLGEQAAWQFLEDNKPAFDLTVINPDIIIGPMLQPVHGPKKVNATNDFAVYSFLNGTYKQIEGLTFPFYHFVRLRMNWPASFLNLPLICYNIHRLMCETSPALTFFLCRIQRRRISGFSLYRVSLPRSSSSTIFESISLSWQGG